MKYLGNTWGIGNKAENAKYLSVEIVIFRSEKLSPGLVFVICLCGCRSSLHVPCFCQVVVALCLNSKHAAVKVAGWVCAFSTTYVFSTLAAMKRGRLGIKHIRTAIQGCCLTTDSYAELHMIREKNCISKLLSFQHYFSCFSDIIIIYHIFYNEINNCFV